MANLIQKLIVEDPSEASSILPQHVALVTPDGEPWEPGISSAATKESLGLVKQAEHVASAAGENVTKAEFEALLDSLEAAGIVASA